MNDSELPASLASLRGEYVHQYNLLQDSIIPDVQAKTLRLKEIRSRARPVCEEIAEILVRLSEFVPKRTPKPNAQGLWWLGLIALGICEFFFVQSAFTSIGMSQVEFLSVTLDTEYPATVVYCGTGWFIAYWCGKMLRGGLRNRSDRWMLLLCTVLLVCLYCIPFFAWQKAQPDNLLLAIGYTFLSIAASLLWLLKAYFSNDSIPERQYDTKILEQREREFEGFRTEYERVSKELVHVLAYHRNMRTTLEASLKQQIAEYLDGYLDGVIAIRNPDARSEAQVRVKQILGLDHSLPPLREISRADLEQRPFTRADLLKAEAE